MFPYRRVLVAYDGSEHAKKALRTAVDLIADQPGAKLSIVLVLHFPSLIFGESLLTVPANLEQSIYELSEQKLEEAANFARGRVAFESWLLEGIPGEGILQQAEQEKCDLIVIGSRGLGTMKRLLIGSVSQYVAQHARVPVLIVK